VDITNNSWGPAIDRGTVPVSAETLAILRNSVLFGRNGLGMINVFSSGNDAGPFFSQGFEDFGNYDSASYTAYVNSRYTIGVTGVDHDGQYRNADGTFTSYPEAGASVLVAAPTGSNAAQNVADDSGQGSGLWTTDLVGDFGNNAAALPNGFDLDRDLLPDPDYTSRFNGTSASAPLVSGVIALMLGRTRTSHTATCRKFSCGAHARMLRSKSRTPALCRRRKAPGKRTRLDPSAIPIRLLAWAKTFSMPFITRSPIRA
jgi:subtilisin family serine protease